MKKILLFCSMLIVLSGCKSIEDSTYEKALNATDLSNLSRMATSYMFTVGVKEEVITFDNDSDFITPEVAFGPSNPKKSTSASIIFKSLISELGEVPLDTNSTNKVGGSLSYGEYGVTPFFKENGKYYFVIYGQSSNNEGDSECASLNNANGSKNPIIDGNDCYSRKVESIFNEIKVASVVEDKVKLELDVEDNAEEIIKTSCKEKYPTKANMESYCIKNQLDAVKILRNGKPDDIKDEYFTIIRKKCSDNWHVAFDMREYCESEQFEAVRVLNYGKPSDISDEKYLIVNNECSDKWCFIK